MKTLTMLFASTVLSAGLTVVPTYAQDSTGDASPVEQVEGQPPAEGDQGIPAGEPVETAAANAPDQEPAFAGQTRAPQPSEMPDVATETFAEGLPQLWAMEFLPDDRMLVTAKEGDFHVISAEGEAGPALSGMIEVASAGQGGLLDVALAPDFETTNRIFFSFAEPRDGGNGTSVARATLNLDDNGGGSLEDVEVIFQQMPTYDGDKHFGSRLVFSPEGHLYVTVGERSDTPIRDEAQSLVSGLGKVFRIDPETGEAIADNPFVEHAKIQPEIWSWGHRNLQSAALDADGRLWTIEHGPRGGDELNMPEAGVNYGWPAITYGIAYSGEEVGPGRTSQEGMEQPVYYWDPVIGPSGMALYEGEEFPSWQDAFLVGGLVTTGLVVLHLDESGEKVAFEERVPLEARIRDVRVGPDGAVYAVTEDPDADTSAILRLTREQ